jgi:hypothetical protein
MARPTAVGLAGPKAGSDGRGVGVFVFFYHFDQLFLFSL